MFKYKKSIIASLVLVSSMAFAQEQAKCNQPEIIDYKKLMIQLITQNTKNQEILLKNFCYGLNNFRNPNLDNPIFYTQSKETLDVFEKNGIDYSLIRSKNHSLDLFSYAIVMKERYKDKKYLDMIEKEINKSYKIIFPTGKDVLTLKPTEEVEKAYFDKLAEKYKSKYAISRDIYGNSLVSYVILGNLPQYIESSFSAYGSKVILFQKNKDGYSPLHLMFSKKFKTEKVEELNNKILSLITERDLMKLKYKNLSYLEYANLLKENNPDFYKKLVEKFKNTGASGMKIDPVLKDIIPNEIDYIKKMEYF